jgi:hypothetical protein
MISDEEMKKILKEARMTMCQCECHRNSDIIHFMACCDFCGIQEDDIVGIERIRECIRNEK